MILKTTILESNPQIIRVFEIDDESSVEDLLLAAVCVHGWRIRPTLYLYRGEKEINKDRLIKELFSGNKKEEGLTIRTLFGNGTKTDLLKDEMTWRMRLEVQDEDMYQEELKAQETAVPRLIRFRGLNPIRMPGNIKNWNGMAQELEKRGHYYDYGRGWIEADDFKVNEEEINKNLRQALKGQRREINVNWEIGQPLAVCISAMSVEYMKNIIRLNNLPIYTNVRKAELSEELRRYISSGSLWMRIFKEMQLDEYEDFAHYVTEPGYRPRTGLYTLRSYGCAVLYSNSQRIVMARELLEAYEELMMTEGDEELLKEKKLREIFACAVSLYGFFTFDQLKTLRDVMYPEDITEKMLSEHWCTEDGRTLLQSELYKSGQRRQNVSEQIMYDRVDFNATEVLTFLKRKNALRVEAFVPDKETALEIARGVSAQTAEKKRLRDVLDIVIDRYYVNSADTVERDIRQMCRKSMHTTEIVDKICARYHISRVKRDMDLLKNAVIKYKKTVRSVVLGGHTPMEAKARFNVELEDRK